MRSKFVIAPDANICLRLRPMLKTGELWVWGQGGSGQLGTKSNKVEDLPTPSKSQMSFIGIAAGKNYSLAISDDLRCNDIDW